jgi:predicted RNA-binding Zn-ribbon protein involved in translation (DUF1610 family)
MFISTCEKCNEVMRSMEKGTLNIPADASWEFTCPECGNVMGVMQPQRTAHRMPQQKQIRRVI